MKTMHSQSAFTLLELLVSIALLGIIGAAAVMIFNGSQQMSSMVLARVELQNNLRQFSQRLSQELQQSGTDENGVLQVTLFNNTGVNNTDIIRFAIPICPCGQLPIDQSGEVNHWGAPLLWGQAGCDDSYTVDMTGQVALCHTAGNSTNAHTLNVNENAIKAHLSHGDYLGICNACNPDNYTNRWIEYSLDTDGIVWRRVLASNGAVQSSAVAAQDVTDFQLSFDNNQDKVLVQMDLSKMASRQRAVNASGDWHVRLRNK